ncbi:MAG: proline--tRNA ligase [bacterium]|nr:proline--tRNA ligase [bacterium]
MRMSRLLSKASKTPPADAESANARFLTQGGFIHQEMAGVYSWLPLGLRTLRKVENIIREEMNALGAQEVLLSALQPKEPWMTTDRWDHFDVLFKLKSQTGKEYALGPTHEEIVTPLVQQFVKSYRDLPVAVYQIQSKFRDELRAKSGILRGREFGMKDLYSFHTSQEDLDAYYQKVLKSYVRIFKRCGLDVKITEASGGDFTKKVSHEFQIITPAGEDLILACPVCEFAQNVEIATLKEGDLCQACGASLGLVKGVEAGNIFDLGHRFTDSFKFDVQMEDGSQQRVFMGCYGIGITRLVGAIVEAKHDDRGIMWPKSVSPMPVHLVSLSAKDPAVQTRITTASEDLYERLTGGGVDVLWDDRENVSPGEKFGEADLLGMPLRLVISARTIEENAVEWKRRDQKEGRFVPEEDIVETIQLFVQEAE